MKIIEIEKVNLLDFEKQHGIELIVTEHANGCWTAHFGEVTFIQNSPLGLPNRAVGTSMVQIEAISNFLQEVSGRRIWVCDDEFCRFEHDKSILCPCIIYYITNE